MALFPSWKMPSSPACASARCLAGRCTTLPTLATAVITAVFAAYFVGGIAQKAEWATFAWTAALSVSYAIVMLTMPSIGAYADLRAAEEAGPADDDHSRLRRCHGGAGFCRSGQRGACASRSSSFPTLFLRGASR